MRILFVTKRRYTGKDLINDRYGRLFEFISGLSRRGHILSVVCVEYGNLTPTVLPAGLETPNVTWHVRHTGANLAWGLWAQVRHAERIATGFMPDVVLSASDAFNVWLGDRLACMLDVPHVADLYDNFEAFRATALPGVKWAFRRALRRCAAIVAVSEPLARLVANTVRPQGTVVAVGNGVDTARFHPGDRLAARALLGLPTDARLIGTTGSLSRSRGIGDLFAAYAQLRDSDERVGLVLAGSIGRGIAVPSGPDVVYLGDVPHAQVPLVLHALDVGVVCNRDSAFGRHCYPQKAVEMLSCRLPTVMADVGVARQIMGPCEQALYRPGDAIDLARALDWQLEAKCCPQASDLSWSARVAEIDDVLACIVD